MLGRNWAGVFRDNLLEHLPVEELASGVHRQVWQQRVWPVRKTKPAPPVVDERALINELANR